MVANAYALCSVVWGGGMGVKKKEKKKEEASAEAKSRRSCLGQNFGRVEPAADALFEWAYLCFHNKEKKQEKNEAKILRP